MFVAFTRDSIKRVVKGSGVRGIGIGVRGGIGARNSVSMLHARETAGTEGKEGNGGKARQLAISTRGALTGHVPCCHNLCPTTALRRGAVLGAVSQGGVGVKDAAAFPRWCHLNILH